MSEAVYLIETFPLRCFAIASETRHSRRDSHELTGEQVEPLLTRDWVLRRPKWMEILPVSSRPSPTNVKEPGLIQMVPMVRVVLMALMLQMPCRNMALEMPLSKSRQIEMKVERLQQSLMKEFEVNDAPA